MDSSSLAWVDRAREQMKRKQSHLCHNAHPAKRVKIAGITTLLENYNNFNNSSIPARVVYYCKGDWIDFPLEITTVLKQAFQGRKSVVEIGMAGMTYLVDFLHMLQIDLRIGSQRSIAWIDVNGKCFFPRVVCERDGELCCASHSDERIEVDLRVNGGAKVKVEGKPSKIQLLVHSKEENQGSSNSIQSDLSSEDESNEGCSRNSNYSMGDNLVKVGEDEGEFGAVREKFISGMGQLGRVTSVVGIYRNSHKSLSGQSRFEAFKSHADEMIKKSGGNANIRYAWHGSSKSGVSGILLHGFGQPAKPKNGSVYGNGIYLAPQHCSYISATYSDVDENGEQHMVLCRVIMGNMEQVKPGSHQFHPSSEQFDTGVDDIQNPKRYIIWSTHMNTHILPEYVVTFKVPPRIQEYWARLKANPYTINRQGNPKYSLQDVQPSSPKSIFSTDGDGRPHPVLIKELPQASLPVVKQSQQSFPSLVKDSSHQMQGQTCVPTSSWMPFPMLFSVIEKHLSSSSTRQLKQHYAEYKASKINRHDLIRRLRMIAGDRVLTSAIKMFQEQVPQMKKISPVSVN